MPRPPQAPNISLLRAIFVLRLGFSLWSHVRIFSVNTASCWKTQDRNLSDQNNHEKRWIVSSWIVSNAIYPHFMTMMMIMMTIVRAHALTKRNDFLRASNKKYIDICVLLQGEDDDDDDNSARARTNETKRFPVCKQQNMHSHFRSSSLTFSLIPCSNFNVAEGINTGSCQTRITMRNAESFPAQSICTSRWWWRWWSWWSWWWW